MLRPMAITRRLRRWVCGGLMMAMLFMQLATAAYACPSEAQAQAAGAAMSAMPDCQAMADMMAMDAEQPQLCKAHCEQGSQASSASTIAADLLQTNPAATILLMGIVEPAPVLAPTTRASAQPPWLLRPSGAPPLYLSLLVLRN